ncbi:c-type cytochrome [Hydrocarboniclastica marina]|uniref:Cytochrome c n=1 Tax=Hydrocarboniclastica marina TaxID=2259620 RepID=A0A4P7XKK5_9ALTE|nr:cytochrome c [Hydrocarboniclastica marina]MAM00260.1 hypothetical protein [Alteromonadaceae bacterium]QCF27588.1 cytochrome c [Hydrocarboniclastica marina]|tara:strand:- start:542 stop:1012 length:471 start_codon:yes stop_codon:yes gene_type:complete
MRDGLKRPRGLGRLLPALLLASIPLLGLGKTAHASEALFGEHCAACHGTEAQGTPGLAPPLAYPALWQGLGQDAAGYLAGVVRHGLSGRLQSQGQVYSGLVMPPQSQLTIDEIASLTEYVLKLSGVDRAVSPGEVEKTLSVARSHRQLRALRPTAL